MIESSEVAASVYVLLDFWTYMCSTKVNMYTFSTGYTHVQCSLHEQATPFILTDITFTITHKKQEWNVLIELTTEKGREQCHSHNGFLFFS